MATPQRPYHRHRGFTLIELMIAVAIVAILAAVALPAFRDSIRKSRRAEAFTALANLQAAQERFRGNNAQYGNTNSTADAFTLSASVLPRTTSSGYYAVAITASSATGYSATATASGSQASDTRCAVIGVQWAAGAVKNGSGASSIDWSAANPDTGKCWAK